MDVGASPQLEWDPSQKGAPLVFLQAHRATVLVSSSSNTIGASPVPEWDPSHSGCCDDLPHAHQACLPASSLITTGLLSVAIGSSGIRSLASNAVGPETILTDLIIRLAIHFNIWIHEIVDGWASLTRHQYQVTSG